MKKIHDIIDSELIVRTSNVRLTQEYGEVGISNNITSEGTTTIFTTSFIITGINYVTVNGVTLVEGKHFYVLAPNSIRISNSGSPVRRNPSLQTTILVSYFAGDPVGLVTKLPPTISMFTVSPTSGRNGALTFNFNIVPYDGKNIYWSILKDGSSVPLFSGNSLFTTAGISISGGAPTTLVHYITEEEYLERNGDDIPFTLVVVYDLSEDGSHLNEKILADASYHVDTAEKLTGGLTSTPEFIISINPANEVVVSYSINKPVSYPTLFDWAVFRSFNNGPETVVKQGNQSSTELVGTYTEEVASAAGQSAEIRYFLKVKEAGQADYTTLANDKTTIAVPSVPLDAFAGYLDAAVMSYVDPIDGQRKKIGSLGTSQDRVEYYARVPQAILTLVVPKTSLEDNLYMDPGVYNPAGTIASVYFVIEAPDNWGPFDFYQALGLINMSAFNRISLGNGYTAYLYNLAPSPVSSPARYYLKSR